MDNVKEGTKEVATEATKEANRLVTYVQDNLPAIISFGFKVLLALVIFFIGRLVIKGIRKLVSRSMNRANTDQGVRQFMDSLLKYVLYIILILGIISGLGISTASVAALFASGGVAIGLALQGSLSNFASGVMILILKPFVVGDCIVEDSNKNVGTVIEIQIFYTKLLTVDGQVVILPNSMMTANSIINMTASDKRQLDLKIRVSYKEDLKMVKATLEEIILKEKRINKEEGYQVFVDELGNSAVILGLRGCVKTAEYNEVKHDVLEAIKTTFDEKSISFPVTELEVSVNS